MGPMERELVLKYDKAHKTLLNQPKIVQKIIIIDRDKELKLQNDALTQKLSNAQAEIEKLSTTIKPVKEDRFIFNPVRRVIDLICYNERVNRRDIVGPSRLKELVEARHLAIYLCITITGLSYPQIGRYFGGRDHTSVLHAHRKIEALRLMNPDLSQKIDRYMEALRGTIERCNANRALRRADVQTASGPLAPEGTACDSLFLDG
jgi:chromosomal replication initiation ATPase DnaA